VKKSTTCSKTKTKLGKAVEVVLGSTKVTKFDSARDLLKKNSRCIDTVKDYECKLALIQTKILAKEKEIKTSWKELEKQFFVSHNCRTATIDEMKNDKNASKYLKQLKYSGHSLKRMENHTVRLH
jgi:hypothetical protein